MTTFFSLIDLLGLVASIFVAGILSVTTIRKSSAPLKGLPVFFLFLGPSAIAVHTGCHIIEIGYTSFVDSLDGTFTYNFRFYSLMLMAGVLLFFNHILLTRLKAFLEEGATTPVLRGMFAIVLISAPTIAFTPIAALPTVACAITLSALPFAKKQKLVAVAARLKLKAKREKSSHER